MARYRKKPVEIEARRLAKGKFTELCAWCKGQLVMDGRKYYGVSISTLEGTMLAEEGDWIIQGIAGEFYPCKPDIFEKTYELVEA